jgi:hypothetical protein
MSIDRRAAARRRVGAITACAAVGAAALTAAFAFGASRNSPSTTKAAAPAATGRAYTPPQDALPQIPEGSGFTPPEASSQPPQAMSGGS